MRQLALGVGDLVDVEEDGAGNVLGEVLGAGVPAFIGHVPGGIKDHEIGRIELAGELVGFCLRRLGLQQLWISRFQA